PDWERRQPGVNLQALWALMGMIDQVLQSIEARRQIWIFGTRLESPQVVGVTSTTDLDEQRIEIGAPRPRQEFVDLRRCLEAIVESIDPDRSQLRRIERLGHCHGRARQ